MTKYAVVFLAWGDNFIQEVETCILRSKVIQKYDLILITTEDTDLKGIQCNFKKVVRASFEFTGHHRKTELFQFLPQDYDVYLFLDSDTIVLDDISLGFEKAEKFGIAVSPAPHYSLDHFWGFDKIMEFAGVDCKGQLQYNTGVIFFKNSPEVQSVFERWRNLAAEYQKQLRNDQPFFTLAMEELDFNPYTLSISYNYRGFGDAISGIIRIWHSHGELPADINEFDKAWPPRRAWPSRVEFDNQAKSSGVLQMFRRKVKNLRNYFTST